jgi:hypothetical protein
MHVPLERRQIRNRGQIRVSEAVPGITQSAPTAPTSAQARRRDASSPASDGELTGVLQEVGLRLAECYCDERSWALRRLLQAEIQNLPDLQDIVRDRASDRVNEALADRLARLALAGHLKVADPAIAAEQFGALLTAPLETRSRLGTRTLGRAELAEVTQNAVQTFLRAFGNE